MIKSIFRALGGEFMYQYNARKLTEIISGSESRTSELWIQKIIGLQNIVINLPIAFTYYKCVIESLFLRGMC